MRPFLKGFVHAFNGVIALIRRERNFRIHFVILGCAVSAGFFLSITRNEWLIIVLTSSVVLAMEAVNTAIEKLCDLYTKERNEQIRLIKDVAAGAVLISAVASVIVGLLIFGPYLIGYFQE